MNNVFIDLYTEAFPPCERRDWTSGEEMQRFRRGHPLFDVRTFCHEGKFAGFLTWWRLPGANYIEHFAVLPSLRGGGLGARELNAFMRVNGQEVILEVERPEQGEMARRRIAFYERLGFCTRPEIDYMQPPYRQGDHPTPLLLMTHGNVPLCGIDDPLLVHLRREVYGCT